MSSLQRNEQQSIEDILEQIRQEVASRPLSSAGKQQTTQFSSSAAHGRHATSELGYGSHKGTDQKTADHKTTVEVAQHSIEPELTWRDAAPESLAAPVDPPADLTSLLKPADDEAPSTNVHAFPKKPRTKLTDALRRARAFGESESTQVPQTAMPSVASTPNGSKAQPASTTNDASLASDTTSSAYCREAAADHASVKRETMSFLDTRFKNLSAPPNHAQPIATALEAPGARQRTEITERGETAAVQTLIEALSGASSDTLALSREEAAALLRPMLKQWLTDNMPRLLEEALATDVEENTRITVRNKVM